MTVSITPSVVSELAIVIVTLSEDGALDRLTVKVAVNFTAVLIGIAGDLRNVETAFGRVIEVSHRNIGGSTFAKRRSDVSLSPVS